MEVEARPEVVSKSSQPASEGVTGLKDVQAAAVSRRTINLFYFLLSPFLYSLSFLQ